MPSGECTLCSSVIWWLHMVPPGVYRLMTSSSWYNYLRQYSFVSNYVLAARTASALEWCPAAAWRILTGHHSDLVMGVYNIQFQITK